MQNLEKFFISMHGVKIHASFEKRVLKNIVVKLKEGHCYLLHNFYTRHNHMRYKTTNHVYRIIASQKTKICEIFPEHFASEMFSFKQFREIADIENIVETSLFGKIFKLTFHFY